MSYFGGLARKMSNHRLHNGYMQKMAASIQMAIISSSNPFVDEFLGGADGVRNELVRLQWFRNHIAANPEGVILNCTVLDPYLYGWNGADKFLACTIGTTPTTLRDGYYRTLAISDGWTPNTR